MLGTQRPRLKLEFHGSDIVAGPNLCVFDAPKYAGQRQIPLEFPWRWTSGTISTYLDVIWGRSVEMRRYLFILSLILPIIPAMIAPVKASLLGTKVSLEVIFHLRVIATSAFTEEML